jgi:hypothetical protein
VNQPDSISDFPSIVQRAELAKLGQLKKKSKKKSEKKNRTEPICFYLFILKNWELKIDPTWRAQPFVRPIIEVTGQCFFSEIF